MICEQARKIDIRGYGQCPPIGKLWYRGRSVAVTSTPCTFGGVRYWFVCPVCDGRCAILYPRLCRKCCNGRYKYELLSPHHRRLEKALRLRARLGQTKGGTLVPIPPKPHRMRWHTYLRLRAQLREIEQEMWAVELKRMFRS